VTTFVCRRGAWLSFFLLPRAGPRTLSPLPRFYVLSRSSP